jgi:hypothetical protein
MKNSVVYNVCVSEPVDSSTGWFGRNSSPAISFVSIKDQHKSKRAESAVLLVLAMGRYLICGNSKMQMRSKNILPVTIQKIYLR